MLRVLLTYAGALVLPAAVFMLWRYLSALAAGTPRNAQGAAQETAQGDGPPLPWTWLSVAGVILLVVTMAVMATLDGGAPDAIYHPPKLIDGKVQPGYFEPTAKANTKGR